MRNEDAIFSFLKNRKLEENSIRTRGLIYEVKCKVRLKYSIFKVRFEICSTNKYRN